MTGLLEVARRAAAHLWRLPAADRRGGSESARRLRRHRFSRLQFQAREPDAEARHPGRLLHQPAALGVAAGPPQDDAPARRSGARDLSVRGGDLPAGGHPGRMGRASAVRRRAAAAAARRVSLAPRSRSVAAGGGAAARQPGQRGTRDPAGPRARVGDPPSPGAAGAVRRWPGRRMSPTSSSRRSRRSSRRSRRVDGAADACSRRRTSRSSPPGR